jgi:hypothetical protein
VACSRFLVGSCRRLSAIGGRRVAGHGSVVRGQGLGIRVAGRSESGARSHRAAIAGLC